MISISSRTISAVVCAWIFLTVSLPALEAYADSQDMRARGSTERSMGFDRTPTPSAPPMSVTPTPLPTSSGGITNVTIGEVNSGSNVGGTVTTGNEEVNVHVVNQGPINNTTSVKLTTGGYTPPPPAPETGCVNERGRIVCSAEDSGRGR